MGIIELLESVSIGGESLSPEFPSDFGLSGRNGNQAPRAYGFRLDERRAGVPPPMWVGDVVVA